jgi:hypothetical protein
MIRAYLSHPIRGAKGSAATREDMEANNQRAVEFAKQVRAAFPTLDLYVPAEHDEFVVQAQNANLLDISGVLIIDRQLVAARDILIVYAPDQYVSAGMNEEIEEAQYRGIPWVFTYGSMTPIHSLLERFLR